MERAPRFFLSIAAPLATAVLLGALPGSACAQECFTPKVWQPKLGIRSGIDTNDNSVHDSLEVKLPTDFVNVMVALNTCCADAADMIRLGGFGTIGYISDFVSILQIQNVMVGDVFALAADPVVAFVAEEGEATGSLDVSNPGLRNRASVTYSPNTVEDAHPAVDGTGVNIAIVDSGVDDHMHESLLGKFVAGYDTFSNTEGNFSGNNYHGTLVAGIAMGTGGPSGVYRGMASDANLVDIRVLNSQNGATVCEVIRGLDRVVARQKAWNIRVANHSINRSDRLSGNGTDCWSAALNRVAAAGVVITAAAGNTRTRLIIPAGADDAFTVGGTFCNTTVDRSDDTLYANTSWGPRLDDGDSDTTDELKPEVVAPGQQIAGPINNSTGDYWDGGNLKPKKTGTSFSAPHVAGLAALIIEANPNITPQSVKNLIINTAEDFGPVGWDSLWGNGLIDAHEAINSLTIPEADLYFVTSCGSPPIQGISGIESGMDVMSGGGGHAQNEIKATVFNAGPMTARNFKVLTSSVYFGNSELPYRECVFEFDSLAVGDSVSVSCLWFPIDSQTLPVYTTACIQAEIVYGLDPDYSNNCTNRCAVAGQTSSPAVFNAQVVNPYDNGEEATITFEHDLADSAWDIQFNPPLINVPGGPGGCPEHLEIILTPLVAEAGSVVVNVTYVGEQTGAPPEPVHFLTVKAINSDALDVEDPPRTVSILPKVYPNPFRAFTTVRFTLSSSAPVDIRVFDVAGRVVRTIQTGELPRGSHEIQWDGRDERGIEVPAGLFFIRLQVGDRKHALRVLKVG